MTPFSEMLEVANRGPASYTAFYDDEAKAYYDLLAALPDGGTIVEIGLQFGRSSAFALQAARDKILIYHGIDCFTDPPEAQAAWIVQAAMIGAPYNLHAMRSWQARDVLDDLDIDLALIDGDHSSAGVMVDCGLILPNIKVGSHVCFHDFGNPGLPDVEATAQLCLDAVEIVQRQRWKMIGLYRSLAVWRREA